MKPYPNRRNGIRLVMIISVVVILLVPLSSTFAHDDITHNVRHNLTVLRRGDMPCVEDPSGAADYWINWAMTIQENHQDEHEESEGGYEHVVGANVGEFSAVPRFDPELPTYEGFIRQIGSFQKIDTAGVIAQHSVFRIQAEGSDGSQVDYMRTAKRQTVNGELLFLTIRTVCR